MKESLILPGASIGDWHIRDSRAGCMKIKRLLLFLPVGGQMNKAAPCATCQLALLNDPSASDQVTSEWRCKTYICYDYSLWLAEFAIHQCQSYTLSAKLSRISTTSLASESQIGGHCL